MFEFLKMVVTKAWEGIQKVVTPLVTLAGTLIPFFREPSRKQDIENPDVFAGTIRDAIEKKDYNEVPINFMYNFGTGMFVNLERDTTAHLADDIDQAAKNEFGANNVIRFGPNSVRKTLSADGHRDYNFVTIDI